MRIPRFRGLAVNIGTFIIRIGFWGPLYCNFNVEPPKIVQVILKAPILDLRLETRESSALAGAGDHTWLEVSNDDQAVSSGFTGDKCRG